MTVFGPDISKYQQGLELSPDDWKSFGFALARASIGERIDEAGSIAAAACEAHGLPFAAYHFVYETSKHAAGAQAETLAESIAGDTRIPIMLDWESDGSELPTFDDCMRVRDAIEAIGLRVTLLYTGGWYWQQMGSPSLARLTDHGIGLIKSDYGSNPIGEADAVYVERGADAGPGWDTLDGITPTLWQFGSQVRIGNVHGDMNAYRGPAGELSKYFASWDGSTPPVDPPTPPVDPTPAYPGEGTYGAPADVVRVWQDAMILNGVISDNPANHDGVWGDGMHNATYRMQATDFGWGDADGIAGPHTWTHLRAWKVRPCPTCGRSDY